jgi:hypothetical protein
MKSSLKPGSYMKTSKVIDWVNKWFPSQKYAEKITTQCEVHTGTEDTYYAIHDLKTIMREDILKEMRCEVITILILN